MVLSGKAILITGGATGIGFALAKQLQARGNRVMICGRRADRIADALAAVPGLGGRVCDLSRDDEIERLVAQMHRELGGIDMLVNNAALQMQTDIAAGGSDFSSLDLELRTNLAAPMKLTQALLPTLLQRHEAAVVNVCSLLAIMPKPNAPGYCASKAGLLAFSESLRLRLAHSRVKVFVAFPPLVDTPMTRGRGSGKMPADAFATEMLRQLERGRLDIRVGQAATLLRVHRFSPGIAAWWTRRMSRGATQPEPRAEPPKPG